MKERALVIGLDHPLIAIITEPDGDGRESPPIAFIIFNAGLVHRVGPARIFVKMARHLAAMGLVAVRFDHSAIGDSEPRQDNLPFAQAALADAGQVMDALAEEMGIRRFVLAGLCSGAVTALKTAGVDSRVIGLVLMNGRGYDEDPEWNIHILNQGRARWYWKHAIFSPRRWWRVLTGRIRYRQLAGVLWRQFRDAVRPPAAVSAVSGKLANDLQAVTDRGARILTIFSEGDHGLDYLRAILGDHKNAMVESDVFRLEVISGAQPGQERSEGPRPAKIREHTTGARHPAENGGGAAGHGKPRGQGLQHGDRHHLVERREGEGVRGLEQRRHAVPRDADHEPDLVAQLGPAPLDQLISVVFSPSDHKQRGRLGTGS